MCTHSTLARAALRPLFRMVRALYQMRYPTLLVGEDARIGGLLRIRRGTRVLLGDRVRLHKTVTIAGGGTVVVGDDTLLNGCWIIAGERVEIGDDCLISDCGITDSDFHNLAPRLRHSAPGRRTRSPITIGRNVWIGLDALILKGVTIGTDSVVGAGAVVRADVPPSTVVSGNPAEVVKNLGHRA